MKQLKVVKETLNTQNTSIIQASFNETITIAPNSRIFLDKLTMTVLSGNTSGISIPAQIIQFSPNHTSDTDNIPFKTVVIPAGTYSTIQDLIDVMNDKLNGALNSNPVQFVNNVLPDIGLSLKVLEDVPNKTVSVAFDQVNVEYKTDAILTDCTLGANQVVYNSRFFIPSSTSDDYNVVYPTPLLQGALQILFKIAAPVDLEDNTVEFGLFDSPTGVNSVFSILLENGIWYYKNNGVATVMPDQSIFLDQLSTTDYYCFYIDPNEPSKLRFGSFNTVSKTDYGITPPGAFAGFDFNTSYFYQIIGNQNNSTLPVLVGQPYLTYNETATQDNRGWFTDPALYLPKDYVYSPSITLGAYPAIPTLAEQRTVSFNFSQGEFLSTGLGLPIQWSYTGFENIITGTTITGFVNYFDLGLDLLNVPIENYISSQTTTGRTNTIAYFTPVRLDVVNSNVYTFENKNLTFLNIGNKTPMVIESLQFRLYNVSNPQSVFNIQGLSFNIFIDSPQEGFVRIE